MMPYICTKVSEKISKGFRVTEGIISLVKFLKGHNSIKNVDKVHILCTSSDNALYLYKIS